MPRTQVKTVARARTAKSEPFNLANSLGVAIIGLLVSLVGTGIVSMIVLYTHVATLTEAETRTEQQLARHLDHSVDRDTYEKRDASIQKQLNEKASKEEFLEMRDQMRDQLLDLKEMIRALQEEESKRRR